MHVCVVDHVLIRAYIGVRLWCHRSTHACLQYSFHSASHFPLGGSGYFIHLPCPRYLSLKLVRVPVRYVLSLFTPPCLSLSATFRSVARGPLLGKGLLCHARIPQSSIRSYNVCYDCLPGGHTGRLGLGDTRNGHDVHS